MPSSRANGNVAQSFNWDAAPVFRRVLNYRPTTTHAAELVEQRLLSAALGSDHMRTHFADMPLVGGNHLPFVEDCIFDGDVIRAGHWDTLWVAVSERAEDGAEINLSQERFILRATKGGVLLREPSQQPRPLQRHRSTNDGDADPTYQGSART